MKLIDYIKNPQKVIFYFGIHGCFKFLDDRSFINLMYWCRFGKIPNWENPITYNEKLQWLKLYYADKRYSDFVDKYEVKKLVSQKIGKEYIIPTIGVWDCAEEIDFESLPNQFVLKCTHDSGGIVICKDKSQLNKDKAIHILNSRLRKNYYWAGREQVYRTIKPRIIAEPYLVDESGIELKDYKVMCFSGEPRLIEVHSGRYTSHQTQDFYDTDWNKLTISQSGISSYQNTDCLAERPETLEQMIELSKNLSAGIPHIRVDWYSIRNRLYLGELTFFDGSGFDPFDDPKDDVLLGSWIELPEKGNQVEYGREINS